MYVQCYTAAQYKLFFSAHRLPSTYSIHCVLRKLTYLQNKGISLWNYVPNSELKKIWQSSATASRRSVSDNGRGQVLSTVDRRPSPVDHIQRPASCRARWTIGLDVARRVGPSALPETCQRRRYTYMQSSDNLGWVFFRYRADWTGVRASRRYWRLSTYSWYKYRGGSSIPWGSGVEQGSWKGAGHW